MQRSLPSPAFASRGFTLIELMVALTGGLLFSGFVFMLAKDTTRFYQNELRLSTATQSVVTGFQRLRSDIARAGYLSSPNLNLDLNRCQDMGVFAATPALQELATLRIDDTDGDDRHTIELMGSYASADAFPIRAVQNVGGGLRVYLQTTAGAMVRLWGATAITDATDADALNTALSNVFLTGRILRIVDKAGAQHFGLIQGVNTTDVTQPFIQVAGAPAIPFKTDAAQPCGLRGTEAGSLVNVVQRIRYSIRSIADADPDAFGPLLTGVEATGARQELFREELAWDGAGTVLANTRELIAEYAVGLHFTLTAADPAQNYRVVPVEPGDLAEFAGAPFSAASRQDRLRSVRVRLAVRSSAPDRVADLLPEADDPVAQGMYRIELQEDPPLYARVRTLQADIALRNQRNARWP